MVGGEKIVVSIEYGVVRKKRKRKQPVTSSFMSSLGSSCLALSRKTGKIKEIQKTNPEFNYKDHWQLKGEIDRMIYFLNELKTIGVKDDLQNM